MLSTYSVHKHVVAQTTIVLVTLSGKKNAYNNKITSEISQEEFRKGRVYAHHLEG